MTFGERLTQLRKENGYATRNEFADKLGIPSTTLRNYETNAREPGHTFLKQISEFFNVSVDYLLCLTDEKEVLNTFRLRLSEQEIIKNYRSLDSFGQETVNMILDRELKRIEMMDSPATNKSDGKVVYPTRFMAYYQKLASAGTGEYIFDDIPIDTIEVPLDEISEKADFVIGVNGNSMEPTFCDGDKVFVERCQIIETGKIGVFMVNNECVIKEAGETGLISHNKNYKTIPGNESIQCIGKVLGKVMMD